MVFGRGDSVANFSKFRTEVRQTIRCLSEAISKLAFRLESHQDAIEFKRAQLLHLLSGGEKAEPEAMRSVLIKELVKELLHQVTPRESHLAILNAKEVGCHHPKLYETNNISALDLHSVPEEEVSGEEWCKTCLNYVKSNLIDELNPFQCWRRGHRSGRIGFVYQLTLTNHESKKWEFDSKDSKLISTLHLKSSIKIVSQKKSLDICKNIEANSDKAKGKMVVTILINSTNHKSSNSNLTAIKQVLGQQLLTTNSSFYSDNSADELDFKEVPGMVFEILTDIEDAWKKHSHSSDTSNNHLGMLIIHNGGSELVDELKPTLMRFHSRKLDIIERSNQESIGSDIFSDIGIDQRIFVKGSVLIVMSLDPIIDLEVKPNA